MFEDKKEIEKILSALGEQLDAVNAIVPEMVVCGGSALNVLSLVSRTTKDVDIVAFTEIDAEGKVCLKRADPFPPELVEASEKVGKDFNLPETWLNPGPTSAVDSGLPEGLMDRVETIQFGKTLTIHFLSRHDQICFKLYAAADQGAGKHYNDLLSLNPTSQELEEAARWSMTHDVSDSYKRIIKELLNHMGHKDVAERL
ncbi:MAG: nucleotidyl transferase AbiEii/AbiGii toxin family protein [Thermodesulfovibrionia bacterium]|nr:nucleotidyl transferase AbiEii/AbiGii toxin family protein [Thermodesulfovibrionia bacterium]